jgi:predicted nucleic acid-binding protein
LKRFGKYAAIAPAVTFTLMSARSSKAIASGGSDGGGALIANINGQSLYLSAVTLGEIQVGIEKTRGQDPDKAVVLEEM